MTVMIRTCQGISTDDSKKRHPGRVNVVDILLQRLDPGVDGAKDAIPKTALLSIVVALPPTLAMVKVMVLDDNLSIQHLQDPAESCRYSEVDADATVSPDLCKGNILMTDPPLIEAHGQTEELHGEVGHHGHANHVEEFLLVVRIGSEEGVGVFSEMVGAMELPETADVMHESMVPIEPEVKNNTIEANLERQPFPFHLRRELVGIVREVGGQDYARNSSLVQ